MADTLLLKNLINGNEDTCLLHIAKTVVNRCSEELHGGRKVHVGIHQRRNIVAELTNLLIQDAVVSPEVLFTEQGFQFTLVSFNFQRFHRDNEVILVIKMLLQEIENHVASLSDIGGIHGHFSKEILDIGLDDSQSTQAVPKIIKCKEAFRTVDIGILVGKRNKRASQLNGLRQIVTDKPFAEMEHVASSKDRLALVIKVNVCTQYITIAADNFLCLWIPDDKLFIAIVTNIKLIQVKLLTRTSARLAEDDFTKSSYLP